jgi:hypothetical protein
MSKVEVTRSKNKFRVAWRKPGEPVPSMDKRMASVAILAVFAVFWPIAALLGAITFALSAVLIPAGCVLMAVGALAGKTNLLITDTTDEDE